MTRSADEGVRRGARDVEDVARSLVARRIGWLAHAGAYAVTLLLLALLTGFLATVIVALAWGLGLAAHGFFAVLVPERRDRWVADEVRRLEQRARDDREVHTQRTSRSLENLAASIAHEIRNPITAAKSLVQQMVEDPSGADNPEYGRVALEELDRVERSISHLLRYAREEPLSPASVPVEEIVESALGTLAPRIERSRVRLERGAGSPVVVSADPEKTRQVIINLVSNALEALEGCDDDPMVEVSAGRNLSGSAGWVRVRDNGPGIPEERLGTVFDPFFTSKASGTGLGLAIAKKLAEAQGGSLEVESEPGRGTAFVLELPTARGAA